MTSPPETQNGSYAIERWRFVDRINALGPDMLSRFMGVLVGDGLYATEKWYAHTAIRADDAEVLSICERLGIDATVNGVFAFPGTAQAHPW